MVASRFAPPRTILGTIAYLTETGAHWGRERFSVSVHSRGRTLRAVSELDDAGILRDTNWTLTPDWKPLEGFVRVSVADVPEGHCWFRIDGTRVECEGVTRELGRVSQRLEVGRPVDFLGFHALAGDALISAARGCTEPGVERRLTGVTNSFAPYGDQGLLACVGAPLVTYVGPERIHVIAGDFDAEHFTVRWSDVVPKYAHFWVHGPDHLPLRLLGASGPVSYELAELQQPLPGGAA